MQKLVLSLFLLFFYSTLSHSAGSLSGRVVDAGDSSKPIQRFDVDLLDPITGDVTGDMAVSVNEDGLYKIDNIPTGEYKVVFNAVGVSSAYQDELYNDILCPNGACDRALLGDIVSIAEGENTLNESLVNTGAEPTGGAKPDNVAPTPTDGFKFVAVLQLLLDDAEGEFAVERSTFNYDPESKAIWSGRLSNGLDALILGKKSFTGEVESIESLHISSVDDPTTSFTAELDAQGRPLRFLSALGSAVFAYNGSSVTMTTTTRAGHVEINQADLPLVSASSKQSQQLTAQSTSCNVDSLFTRQIARGDLVFACDSAYDYTDLSPPTLDMTLKSQGEFSATLDRPILALNKPSPNNQPEISKHAYEYTMYKYALTANPPIDEWNSCCLSMAQTATIKLSETQQKIADTAGAFGTFGTIKTIAKCLAVLGTGGIASAEPTLALSCVNLGFEVFSVISEAIKGEVSDQDSSPPACSGANYEADVKQHVNAVYGQVDVQITKNDESGYLAVYSASGKDLTKDEQGDTSRLPTLTLGPVPADFQKDSTINKIEAYRSNGDEIAQAGGMLILSSVGEADTPAVIEVGERLDFRAFDQFFDRSKSNPFGKENREDTQHYTCAAYQWTLARDGEVVEQRLYSSEPDSDDGYYQTSALLAGDYELTLEIKNDPINNSYLGRQWLTESGTKVETLPPVSAYVSFTVVKNDDDDDGVSNSLDLCPALFGIVDNEGCPEDFPKPGVYSGKFIVMPRTDVSPEESLPCNDFTGGDVVIEVLYIEPSEGLTNRFTGAQVFGWHTKTYIQSDIPGLRDRTDLHDFLWGGLSGYKFLAGGVDTISSGGVVRERIDELGNYQVLELSGVYWPTRGLASKKLVDTRTGSAYDEFKSFISTDNKIATAAARASVSGQWAYAVKAGVGIVPSDFWCNTAFYADYLGTIEFPAEYDFELNSTTVYRLNDD